MSISSSGTRKAGPFSGNGSTTAFPFSFKVFQASDVLVVQTDTTPTDYTLTINTDYTVALNANQDANPGGTVNMTVAPPSGYMLTIGSQVPQVQSVTLTNNGGFYPTVINTALDYLTILVQQLGEKVGRALVMPFSTNASGQLPPVAPGQLLGWKADGSGIANVGASGVGAGSIVASNMAAGATGTALSGDTQAAATKATPTDTDKVPLFDSANFWYLKSLTWANLKATLGSLLNMTGAVNFARTTVASSATPDIWTGTGNNINYTGTATATGFAAAPQAGASRILDCAGACAFTAGANMLIDGIASGNTLTVVAGDRVEVFARTTTQFVLRWLPSTGLDVPPGTIIEFAGTAAPQGYLLCPTSATTVSRTTYAALFAAIGTTWGAGDGSTTFGIPYFPADYAPVQANANVGSQTVGQVINHVHPVSNVLYNITATATTIVLSNGSSGFNTGNPTTGGSANLAAGVRVLRCVKY
jgi:hypothetical protein